jgi:hypothetical protein
MTMKTRTRAHLLVELAMGAALASVLAVVQIGHAQAVVATGDEILAAQQRAEDGYAAVNSLTLAQLHGRCR